MVAGTVQGWRGGEVGMEPPGELEFQYRSPWWWRAVCCAAAVCMGCFVVSIIADLHQHYQEWARLQAEAARLGLPPLGPSPMADARIWSTPVCYALYALVYGWLLVHDVLLVRRGLARITESGLDIVDWRGRSRRLGWLDIRDVGVVRLTTTPSVRICPVKGRGVWFDWRLERPLALAEAVAARAGLTEQRRTWWGVRCTRPTE
jgi:hypothetical protein